MSTDMSSSRESCGRFLVFLLLFWNTAETCRFSQVRYKWEACLSSLVKNHTNVAILLNMNLKRTWSPQHCCSRCEWWKNCTARGPKTQWAKESMVLSMIVKGAKESCLLFLWSQKRLILSATWHTYKCRTGKLVKLPLSGERDIQIVNAL